MKQSVPPAVIAVAVVILIAIVGFLFFKFTGTDGGARPTQEQADSGPKIGNKRFPGAAPMGASGGGGGTAKTGE